MSKPEASKPEEWEWPAARGKLALVVIFESDNITEQMTVELNWRKKDYLLKEWQM